MTEEEWLACIDWRDMLEYVEGKVTDRKLRPHQVRRGDPRRFL